MSRYFVRFSVALLTFIIGVIVNALPIPFHRAWNSAVPAQPVAIRARSFRRCYHAGQFLSSPVMSIETSPGEPLTLRYSTTSIDAPDPGRRQVHFMVENSSEKDIKAYSISWTTRWESRVRGGGGRLTFQANSPEEILMTGATRPVVINSEADEMLTLSVDSVEFVDGSHWYKSSRLN